MDYFTLNRRELQALCKKHAIPANLTNVSMAEALTALLNVDDNKPSDDGGDKSVLTDISNTPRKSTKSKRHGVAAEGKSAEEPIVLDDDEAPSALKEKHMKSATKTLKGKGGDPMGKSRSKIRQGKILDKDANESSDAVTPYTSVKVGRSRTCKKGTNAKNPKTRSCCATHTDDTKPVQQKYDSRENEEESDEANNGSIEEVTETRPKLSGEKVDKAEMATEESTQVSTNTEDAKSQQQEHDSCEKEKESEEANNVSVEEVPKARPKGRLSRKKVDKAELATGGSIQVSTHTEDAKYLQQEHDSCENEKESDEANNGLVKEVPEARPKGRLSRKKVDKAEMAMEESIQVSTHIEDNKPLQQEHESCEQKEGTDEANNGSVEEVPKARPKGRLSRKKVDKVEMATEERMQESVDANDQSAEVILKTRPKARPSRNRVDKLEAATEESIQGTNNTESVEEVHETRHKSIRKKFDGVKEAADDNIHGSIGANDKVEEDTRESTGMDDANGESVKEVPDVRFKVRSSKKKVDEDGEATDKSIQGTDDSYDESVKEVPENRPKGKSSRKKVEEATEESIKGTDDVNYESVEEISRTRPKGKSSRKKAKEATEERIKWTDDVIDEISRTRSKGEKSSRKRPEELAEENIQGVDDESKGDRNPICRRSTRANALKGLDTQPSVKISLSRRKYSGVDSVKETPGDSKRIKDSTNKNVEYYPAETSVKVSAKKNVKTPVQTRRALSTKKDSTMFLDGDTMEESASKVNKQLSICTRTNQIQNLHHSADVKNEGELNFDLDCSEIKQDRVGRRRTAKKATAKSHCKDIHKHTKELDLLEADLDAKGKTEAFEGKVSEEAEAPKGIDSEEVTCGGLEQQMLKTCQNLEEEQMPSSLSQAESTKQVQNKSTAEKSSNRNFEILESPTAEKVNEIRVSTTESIMEKHNTDLKEVKMNTDLMLTDGIMVCTEQPVKLEAGSALKKNVFRNSTDTREGEAPGIEDMESWEKAVIEGADSGTEPEIVHEDLEVDEIAGFSHCIQSRDIELEERFRASCEKAVEEGVNIAGSHSGAEPRTMQEDLGVDKKAAFSHGMALGDIEQYHIDAQESEAHAIEDENCEKAVRKGINVTESHSGPEPETKHNNLEVDENAAFSHGIDSRDAQKGEALCIEVEEIPGKTVQNSLVIAGSDRIELQTMHLISNAADNATFPYGMESKFVAQSLMHALISKASSIKGEENQGESMQEGVSTAESPKGTEPETMCAQEGKAPGIKDEESQGESTQEGVSIAESTNGTEPETMCSLEGRAPGFKDEETQGESMQKCVSIAESSNGTEPEIMCAQEGEALDIKEEESWGESMQEGVSITESPNRTEPETMCAQEGKAPVIKDEVSQGESMQEGVSKAESSYGTEPETVCARESKSLGIKEEERQWKTVRKTVNIGDSQKTEPDNMHSPGGEASGIKDEADQLKTIQEGSSKAESSYGTQPETVCARESKSLGIKDEEKQWKTVQKTVSIADSHNETEPENMHSLGGEASGIKDEADRLKTIQEGIGISESQNRSEPETMHLDPKVGRKPVFCYGMDSTCIEQSNEILTQNDYELNDFDDVKQLNSSRELLSASSARAVNQVEDSAVVLDREPEYASWKETTPNMMVVQEIVIGEPRTVAGPTEKDCLHTEAFGSDDLKLVVGKPPELKQCTANLGDETIDNIMEGKLQVFFNSSFLIEDVHEEIHSDIDSTEEDPGAKNSEDLVLSVMPNILESQGREGISFANVEGQDKNVPGEVHNNELCSDEVHISFSEIKQQSLVQNSPVTPPMKTKDGATEGKVQLYKTSSYSNDKSYEEVPTGLEDEDVCNGIQAHFSNNVSEAATNASIGNGEADLMKRLASLSIDNEDQIDVRVTSSSVQVDNEVKAEKRMASSSVQIDSEVQIEKFISEVEDGKKEAYSACIRTVEERIKDSTIHDETGSNKSPLAKELIHYKAKHFVLDTVEDEKLNGFNDETGSKEEFVPWTPPKEERHILVPTDDGEESSHVELEILVASQSLGNNDEGSEVMDSQEEFKTNSEVEDQDIGMGNNALQGYEQNNTKEFEKTPCQTKAPLCMADTHFHEKTCGPDEQVQVTYVDKLQSEANNNVLLIEKENSPFLTGLSLCKLRAIYKDKMAKDPVSMKDTHFQEKTCNQDEEIQVTCGNKLQNKVKKENSAHLKDLSLRKLKALYKEKKVGKRSALHDLSSNDLEEREKVTNKAEL